MTCQNDIRAPKMPDPALHREEECVSVTLTHDDLNPLSIMAEVKSPKAGAIVLFAGTLSVPYSTPLPSQSYQVLHVTTSMARL